MAYLVGPLARLRSEVDALWPNRSKASDGWLGDPAHAARVSDHNADWLGRVHAVDLTAAGIDADRVVKAAIAHPATDYVIHDGLIYSRTYGFRPQKYLGENPHKTHVHVSARKDWTGRHSTQRWLATPWLLPDGVYLSKNTGRRLWNGSENALAARHVRLVQGDLGVQKTGRVGYFTDRRIKRAQALVGLPQTGVVGPEYWARRGI